MQVQFNEKQLNVLVDLVTAKLDEMQPNRPVRDSDEQERGVDEATLLDLREKLRKAEAWQGYVEMREVPSNPAPG